jgi:DNA repair exonuclease SbcCD nuclease subunit
MPFIAFADFHAHDHQDFSSKKSRFSVLLDVLDQIIALAKANNASILFAGDLFHKRSYIHTRVFNPVAQKIAGSGVRWIMIPGDHDRDDEGTHSLETLGLLDNVEVLYDSWSKPTQYCNGNLKGGVYGLAPFAKMPKAIPGPCIVLAHGIHAGSVTPTGHVMTAGSEKDYRGDDFIDPNIKLVVMGDIHKPQQFGKVWVPGSPCMHDFGDVGDEKSVLLIADDLSVTRVPLKAPRFIDLTPATLTQEAVEKGDDENYYRIALAANASQETEETLRQKFPNSVFTREAVVKQQRAEIIDPQDHRSVLGTYHDYAKLELDREKFIVSGLAYLSAGRPGEVDLGKARQIEFRDIFVENFGPFKKAHLQIKEGVWLVTGSSDDPSADSNSIGKSYLITEAIVYCLYGILARSSLRSPDKIIHDPKKTGKEKGLAVRLKLKIGDDRYTFVRARKHPEHGTGVSIEKNGAEIKASDMEAELAKIWAIPFDVLTNIAIFPQRGTMKMQHKPFLACTDAERKEILESALSIGAYGVAGDRVFHDLTTLQTKQEGRIAAIAVHKAVQASTEATLARLVKERQDFDSAKQQRISELTTEIQGIVVPPYDEAEQNRLQQEKIRLGTERNGIVQASDSINQRLSDAAKKLGDLNSAFSGEEKNANSIGSLITAEIQGHTQDIAVLEEGKASLSGELLTLRASLGTDPTALRDEKVRTGVRLKSDRDANIAHADAHHKKAIEIQLFLDNPAVSCPTCHQAMPQATVVKVMEDRKREMAAFVAQETAFRAQAAANTTEMDRLRAEVIDLGVAQTLYCSKQAGIREKEQKLVQVESTLASLRKILFQDAEQKSRHAALLQAVEVLRLRVAETSAEVSRLEAEQAQFRVVNEKKFQDLDVLIARVDESLRGHETARAAYTAAVLRQSNLRASLESTTSASFPSLASIQQCETTITAETAAAAARELEVQEASTLSAYLVALVAAFGPAGIVSLILDGFLAEFQAITTELCNTMTLGTLQVRYDTEIVLKKKRADGQAATKDKFDVLVSKSDGADGAEIISGSDQQKANLIIEQALSRLVARRSNIRTNIRVYDEVFDGLNATSTEYVARSLMTEEPGVAKFVITHKADLASMFPNQILINKKAGVSTLVV